MSKNQFIIKIRYIVAMIALFATAAGILYWVHSSFIVTFPPVDRFVPEVTGIESFDLKEIRNDSLVIDCSVRFYNPNPVDITISNIRFDVLKAGVQLGVITSDSSAVFTSADTVTIAFRIRLVTEQMVGIFTEQPDTLHIVMRGPVYAEVLGGNIDREIEFPFSIAIKEQMNGLVMKDSEYGKLVTIRDPKFGGFSLKKTTIDIPFVVNNPYGLTITVVNYRAKIYINDKFIGNGGMISPLELGPNQQGKQGIFRFDADNMSTATTLPGILLKQSLNYSTRGTISVKVFDYVISIPYNHNGKFL